MPNKFVLLTSPIFKKNLKFLYKCLIRVYKFFLFLPTIFFLATLIFLFNTFFKKYKKIVSLRITPKYFGHLAIEPAILSSYCSGKNRILPIVSFKNGASIKNTKLENIAKSSFNVRPDILNKISEHIFNYSFESIKLQISHFYFPLLEKNSKTRVYKS